MPNTNTYLHVISAFLLVAKIPQILTSTEEAATHRDALMENYSFCVWATGGITGRALLSLSAFKCIILTGKIFTPNREWH